MTISCSGPTAFRHGPVPPYGSLRFGKDFTYLRECANCRSNCFRTYKRALNIGSWNTDWLPYVYTQQSTAIITAAAAAGAAAEYRMKTMMMLD